VVKNESRLGTATGQISDDFSEYLMKAMVTEVTA